MPSFALNNSVRTPLLVLGVIEALVLFSSVYFAGAVQYGNVPAAVVTLGPLWPRALIVTIVLLASLIAMGLYQFHQRLWYREASVRLIVAIAAGGIALAVIYYALPGLALSREINAIAVSYALVLLLIVRLYFVRNVDTNVFRRKILVYGAGERAARIAELRRRADRRGFKVVGQVVARGDTDVAGIDALRLNGKTLVELAEERGAEEIVVAMDDRRGNLPIRQLLDCRLRGIEVCDLIEFLERETGKIWIELVRPGWLIFSPGFRVSKLRHFNKRLVDFLASSVLMLVALPVMLIVAIAIKFEDGPRSPILYRQKRVGRNNRVFYVLKFRSMRVDAEASGQAVWASKDDDRITRVGAVLRKLRLDELPQILNVFRGQMSLVGPRPERPEFVQSLRESIPYYAERHTVNPGVTGWAQLRYSYGANEEDALEKLQYDLYYVKNQSLLLDLMIILQTVEVVLWGKGAR
ncbi:MAG: TIGR03013 family XrtA/PEP-CTERM system glycosyltransferase [Woeseia sp.]